MSTAGKVLVVLVTLMLLGWLGLLAMVARLNDNWGELVVKNAEQIAALEKQLGDTTELLAKVKTDIAREQTFRDLRLVELRTDVADREQILTHTIEALERVKNQVKSQQEAEKLAELGKKRRNDEKAETEKAIEAAKAEVQTLTGQNETLLAQLDRLQKDFISTLGENKQMVQRMTR
jgi:hypothetical protein